MYHWKMCIMFPWKTSPPSNPSELVSAPLQYSNWSIFLRCFHPGLQWFTVINNAFLGRCTPEWIRWLDTFIFLTALFKLCIAAEQKVMWTEPFSTRKTKWYSQVIFQWSCCWRYQYKRSICTMQPHIFLLPSIYVVLIFIKYNQL